MLLALIVATIHLALSHVSFSEAPAELFPHGPIRIVLVGDSTVREYLPEDDMKGWGQYLAKYFDDQVTVINLAKDGASTKTFIAEGLWDAALAAAPHFVLIQLGHNDSRNRNSPVSTEADSEFRDNLRRFVDEARAAHATPVLVTPMHRRTFHEDGTLISRMDRHVAAIRTVAAEQRVGLVDLYAATRPLFENLGPAGLEQYANRPGDYTHFNEQGARLLADLVMAELPSSARGLRAYLLEDHGPRAPAHFAGQASQAVPAH
jgi:lysophospholipase L1-like esterase